MKLAAAILLGCLAFQEDSIADLKKLPPDSPDGRKLLIAGLEAEMKAGLMAIEEARLDEAETRLLRAAQLARPYSEDHARRIVRIILALRNESRSEGAALVRALADDLKANRADAADRRLTEAQQSSMIAKTYKADLEALRKWIKAPPAVAVVDAEIARWRALVPSRSTCGPCKGAGELDCPTCTNGTLDHPCRMCAAKGQNPCILCDGRGTLLHIGCVGRFRLTLDKDTSVIMTVDGKPVKAKLYAQVVTWETTPCAGKGEFTLTATSRPKDPGIKPMDNLKYPKKCGEFFKELRNFVFSGKAKIELIDDIAKPVVLTAESAKRFFAEYEKCKDGRVSCDRCAGKLQTPCDPCGAKGTRLGPCSDCGGTMMKSCDTCRLSGDSAWLAALVPPAKVPEVSTALAQHALRLGMWQDRRSQQLARREQIRQRLEDARQGLDPAARIGNDLVNVVCPVCKGRGGQCDECWGTGRREYADGTPQFEKYATVKKLSAQVAELSKSSLGLTPKLQVPREEVGRKDPVPPPPPPPPDNRSAVIGSGIGGAIGGLPDDLQAQVKLGDAAYQQGKSHLEKAKASTDPETWTSESRMALKKLKEAQGIFTTVQEALDERGIDVPKDLLDLVRNNLQALVMARKQSP